MAEDGVSFPGCIKGLVHFLDVHQHLHLRRMKMLAYRRRGEGKHLPRTKVANTDPDATSTSQQHVYMEDPCFAVEGNINDVRKSGKSFIRISIPKWRLREQHKKRKVFPPVPRLLRTASIHHRSENLVDNVNSWGEASAIKQNTDMINIYASSQQLNIMPSTFDEDILETKCDKHWSGNISGSSSQTQFDELESHLQIKQQYLKHFSNEKEDTYSSQKDTDVKELQGDITLYPSKEFLAMMKLFNGNIVLIQKILEDPSFIFAHYLQGQKATNAQLNKTYSFPATGILERKGGLFRTKHKRFESGYLVKESGKYISDLSPSHPETVEDNTPKTEATAGNDSRTPKQNCTDQIETIIPSDIVAPPSILQKMYKPSISSRFKVIKQRFKEIMKDHKKEPHHISMDGVLHKVPSGKNVLKDMKKRKPGHWEGSDVGKHNGEGSRHADWNKRSNTIQTSMERSHSLNDSLHKYSNLFESISKVELEMVPGSQKWMKEAACKMSAKTLGRIFSLPNMEYYSSSKDDQSEMALRSLSPKKLTTEHKVKSLEREESIEFTTELSSTQALIVDGKILPQSNGQDQSQSYKVLRNLLTDGLTFEGSTPQELELMDESYITDEPKKQSPVSAIRSFSLEVDSLDLLNHPMVEGLEHKYQTEQPSLLDINAVDGFGSNDADLESVQSSAVGDSFSSLNLDVSQKDEVEFNYVREILKRSGLSGTDCFGAWHSPYKPVNPLTSDEVEGFPYEIDIAVDKHVMQVEPQILLDLISEALMAIYENSFGYFFPWLSSFSTHIRPVPIGYHILEEVWANISWHLKRQPQLEIDLGSIVAQDFTKHDGWMNLQYDIEDVELEVDDVILDDLLDDVVLQLLGLPGSSPNSCSAPMSVFS